MQHDATPAHGKLCSVGASPFARCYGEVALPGRGGLLAPALGEELVRGALGGERGVELAERVRDLAPRPTCGGGRTSGCLRRPLDTRMGMKVLPHVIF